jgi:hypothetical protein
MAMALLINQNLYQLCSRQTCIRKYTYSFTSKISLNKIYNNEFLINDFNVNLTYKP